MTTAVETIRDEPRWPPALAILLVLLLLAALPGHVYVMPVWVSYLAALAGRAWNDATATMSTAVRIVDFAEAFMSSSLSFAPALA